MFLKRSVLYFIFNFFFSVTINAQNTNSAYPFLNNIENKDKVNVLLDTAKSYISNNPKKSSKYIKDAIQLLNEYPNDSVKGKAYSFLGKTHYYLANYDSALIAWEFALKTFQSSNNSKGVAELYNNIGVWYYSAASNYDKALDYYLLSLKKREEIKDSSGIASSLINIGNIYYKQNRRDKAIESYEKALFFAEAVNDKKEMSILLNNLGVEYEFKKEYEKALNYYFKSAEIKKSLNNLTSLAVTYGSIGSTYKRTKKYDKALEYYDKSLEILKENSNKYYTALIYNYVSGVYKETKQYSKSLSFLNKSLSIAKEINDKSLLENNYKEFSEIYNTLKNFKKAYIYQKKYIILHDSIFNDKSDERMKEMEVKYETDKKEKENQILKTQQQINELELEKKTNRQYFLLAVLFLFLIFVILIYSRYRLKQKTNIVLEDANTKLQISQYNLKESIATKDKFFSIIAHDLRNPLSSLSLVSQVLEEKVDELSEEKLKYYIGSISKASDSLLNLVENLLSWARTQTDKIVFSPENVDLFEIVEQNINLLKFNSEKKNIQIKNTIHKGTFVFADINLLTTVIRNLLANAVKFTNTNGFIEINLNEANDLYEVSVKDNGIGMSDEDVEKLFRIDIDTTSIGNSSEKGTGLGLILCKEFVEKNGGTIRVKSEQEKGSLFIFTVKKHQNNNKYTKL